MSTRRWAIGCETIVTGPAPHCGAAVWDLLIIRWSKSRRLVGRRSQHPTEPRGPAVALGATQSPTPSLLTARAPDPQQLKSLGTLGKRIPRPATPLLSARECPQHRTSAAAGDYGGVRCRGNTLNVSWRRNPRERSVCRHVGCCSPAAWWMPKKAKRSATYPERPEASCANTGLSGRSGGRPGDRGASSRRQRTESSQRTPVSEQDPVCPDTRSNDE
jgi:hypothetical protein